MNRGQAASGKCGFMNPYIIADVGVNYYDTARVKNISPILAAKEYVKAAQEAGISAVKFQSYKAGTLVSKNSPAYWDLGKEPTSTQYELFQKYDKFNKEEYLELYQYCREVGIDFLSTPFDFESVDYLADLVDVFKISSSDLTNLPFVSYVASKKKPIYLSTGASYLSEIEEAVRTIKESGGAEICLMHCVLSYPCKNEDANLNMIKTLKQVFPDAKIGYSDHTEPDTTMTILATAYLYGAEVIEKHFTLDKNLTGNDHYHAGNPDDFKLLIKNLQLIKEISGEYEKTVLPCEGTPRREARRSLVLTRDVKCGEEVSLNDIAFKRPGTGIPPKYIDIIAGRTYCRDLLEDTVLTWDMV